MPFRSLSVITMHSPGSQKSGSGMVFAVVLTECSSCLVSAHELKIGSWSRYAACCSGGFPTRRPCCKGGLSTVRPLRALSETASFPFWSRSWTRCGGIAGRSLRTGTEKSLSGVGLLRIKGVGEKIAECVVGYGWGQEALPMDGNGCRVIERLAGQERDTRPWSAAYVRQRLRALYEDHREWMTSQGVAMIDIHEVLRLHGQVLCTRRPQCSRCPVSVCLSRRQAYSGSDSPGIDGALWQEWRELLLDGPTPGVEEED